MKYVFVENNQLKNFIDREIIPEIYKYATDKVYIFGGINERNKIVSLAIFEECSYDKRNFYLNYIWVEEKLRGTGLANELLEFCSNLFKNLGARYILGSYIVASEDAIDRFNIMSKLDFNVASLDKPVLYFKKGHFQGEKADKLWNNISKSGLNIVDNLPIDDKRLIRFFNDGKNTGIDLSIDDYNQQYCVFVVSDNSIDAAICSVRSASGDLLVKGLYFDPKININIALPFMMSVLIHEGNSFLSDDNGIYVEFKRESVQKTVISNFGESAKEFYRHEYFRRLF